MLFMTPMECEPLFKSLLRRYAAVYDCWVDLGTRAPAHLDVGTFTHNFNAVATSLVSLVHAWRSYLTPSAIT
jgi:hypothetical protein